jgi:hypothetical protein
MRKEKRDFKNMMLRRMYGPKRDAGGNFTMRSVMICRLLFILLGSYSGGDDGSRERRALKLLVGKP